MTTAELRLERLRKELSGGSTVRLVNGNEVHVDAAIEEIPGLCQRVRDACRGRLAMIVCSDERGRGGSFVLRYVLDLEGVDLFAVLVARVDPAVGSSAPTFASVAHLFPTATRYEREVKDMFGLVAVGNPDLRPMVLHDDWPDGAYPLRKDFDIGTKPARAEGRRFEFIEVGGEGVSEIPVGPVHAGIIEPGHFRFSVLGESVINLEARLYYTHRGVEKLAEGMTLDQALLLSERISGDEAVANSTAYCQALERVAGVEAPERARQTRAVCAEMERIHNHLGTLAGLSIDAGFAYGGARLRILKERMMRLNEEVAGSRLLFGVNRIGGTRVDIGQTSALVSQTVRSVLADSQRVIQALRNESSVMDRFSGTGAISPGVAAELGLLGVTARSSGLDVDTRRDHPYGAYAGLRVDKHHDTKRQATEFGVELAKARGDVLARFDARVEEVENSADVILQVIGGLHEAGPLSVPVTREMLTPFGHALGYAESHRGRTLHWVMVGEDGDSLFRYKVRTASFANWPAIEVAVLNDILADFPLVNKSLDLSYAGNDL